MSLLQNRSQVIFLGLNYEKDYNHQTTPRKSYMYTCHIHTLRNKIQTLTLLNK